MMYSNTKYNMDYIFTSKSTGRKKNKSNIVYTLTHKLKITQIHTNCIQKSQLLFQTLQDKVLQIQIFTIKKKRKTLNNDNIQQ